MGYWTGSTRRFAQEKIHPDYYQCVGILHPQPAQPSLAFGTIWFSSILLCSIVICFGAIQAFRIGMDSSSQAVSISPPSRTAAHGAQRIRIHHQQYLRRIEQVETNVHMLTNVLTVMHSTLMEAVGDSPAAAVNQGEMNGQADPRTVVVTVPKANLRTGPGLNTSAVMAVSRGTELLVDTVEGPWLRIFAPNGEMLWVAKEVVS